MRMSTVLSVPLQLAFPVFSLARLAVTITLAHQTIALVTAVKKFVAQGPGAHPLQEL
jgi:hypothetical protein